MSRLRRFFAIFALSTAARLLRSPGEAVRDRFLAAAAADLDELYSHIAKETSQEMADRYLDRLESFCLSLSTLPARGAVVPGRVAGLRRMGFERRAMILFRVGEDTVEILRILYGGRDLSAALEEILAR